MHECLNKPFKAYIHAARKECLVGKAQCSHSASQYQQHQGLTNLIGLWLQTIASTVEELEHCLNSQMDTVKVIFIVCGISNSLDGRENKLARAPPELPSFTVAYGVEQAYLFLSSEEYNVD